MNKKEHSIQHERAALLALLRAGLWEQAVAPGQPFPLSEAEWRGVYRLSRQQTVTGIAFQGLTYLSEEQLPPEALLIRWAAEADAVERRNRQMNRIIGELSQFFSEEGLHPVLQKGQGVARYYGRPLLRMCGDIDFYFAHDCDWKRALQLIRQRHLPFGRQADGSLYYSWKGITVEHHRRLFDAYNPFSQRFLRQLERQHGCVPFAGLPESAAPVCVPAPLPDLLLLNLHVLKHALGRGIGLRQLCDLACACRRLHADISPEEMKAVCSRLGLGRWTPLLHAFLTDCLGLPAACLPYPEKAESASPLEAIVWRGGNFGQYDAAHDAIQTGWRRKWQTARSYGRNVGFACRYAPGESVWLFLNLLKGQHE